MTRHYQLIKEEWMFQPHVTWTKISSADTSFRLKEAGQLFDMAGASLIPQAMDECYRIVAFCNSSVARTILRVLAPTLNYQSGDIGKLPLAAVEDSTHVNELALESIELSRTEWNHYETSWGFTKHPLI